jgi:heptosyltransferase-2
MRLKLDNILIVNTFGIGDVLFSTPLIEEIKRSLPRSNIHYICNRRNLDLLKNNPYLTSVLVFEKDDFRQAKAISRWEFVKMLVDFVKKIKDLRADVAIDLTLNYQMSIFLILAGVRRRIGFNYNDRGRFLTQKTILPGFNEKHVVEYYLDLLKFLDLGISDRHKMRSFTSAEDRAAVDAFLEERGLAGKSLVGIVAAGGKSWGADASYRRWDKDNFAYVGKKISEADNDARVLMFGTKEEKDICEHIRQKIGERAVSLCGDTSLGLLVEFVSRCRLVICNEGGPMHIAVSQDVKTISIFGPVDDKIYGPYPSSGMHKVVTAGDVACRPCYRNFKHRLCDDHICLTGIDKDRVFSLAKEILGLS